MLPIQVCSIRAKRRNFPRAPPIAARPRETVWDIVKTLTNRLPPVP
jgi:hypothetical protein